MTRLLVFISSLLAFGGLLGVREPILAAGASAQGAPPQAARPVRFELPNGLRVWMQEDHRRPVVLVQTSYRVGSINEGPGTTGTAHYVEHMVYRATDSIRNEDIYGFVDRIGGRWTGSTGSMATTYGETVPSWALEEALRITAERVGRARFDSTEFQRERSNVATEANGFSDTGPVDVLRNAVMRASFDVHPYRYNSNTWVRDNLDLTRAEAYAFYRRFYGPNNAVLTIVGDIALEDARNLVEKHFGSLTPAPESGRVRTVEPPQQVEKRVTLVHPVDTQRVEIVFRAPEAASTDYPVLVVLDRLLQARLQHSVAAAGATVSTGHRATPYPHVYRISAATSASASADLEGIVRAVEREIERLGVEDVAADELAAARIERRASRPGGADESGETQDPNIPPRAFPGLAEIARELNRRETLPWEVGPERLEEIRRAQTTVTSGQIRAYADRWLRPSQRTVGLLVAGASTFRPEWSDGRAIVGERLEMPPMTVPPAKRATPTPVPPRALESLAPLRIAGGRRALSNGVVVRAARKDGGPAALQVRFEVGNAADPAGKEGLALLAARILAGDPALSPFDARVQTASIANDGFFDIRVTIPESGVRGAVETVVRALGATSVAADRVDQARAKLLEELAEAGDAQNSDGAGEARNRVLSTADPIWRTTAGGSRESVARITAEDVSLFLSRRLARSPAIVSLVGPRDPPVLLDLAAAAFATWPPREPPGAPAVPSPVPAAVPPTRSGEERVPRATERQVEVVAGLPGVARGHPDRRALVLLNYIAGVPYYGGRLGWALTKSGLTYSSAAATTFGATTGHILFSTTCDTRNLESTLQALREVIAGIGEAGVTEWELREAQAFTLGRTVLYGPREDSEPETLAGALLDSESSGEEVLDLPALSRATLAVTLDQVNAVARRYYRSDLLRVVALGAVPDRPGPSPFSPGTFRALFEP